VTYYLICLTVFLSAYLINLFYISVLYHRGLTHGAVRLRPWMRTWVIHTGNWVTGLDPKAWACMHRLHHQHSDTELDPHSPMNFGIFGVMLGQLRSYERVLVGLHLKKEQYLSISKDLDFQVNWLNRKKLWYLPYVLHAALALSLGFGFHAWLLGGAYWFGMMSHPIQGWMVNSFAHKYGYQNFENGDHSRNNALVAWLVFGEGYQNNHHAQPASPKFSVRWFEFDAGYVMCRVAKRLAMLDIGSVTPVSQNFAHN
jgi:stearoyl-CoA desaturase (delta-9 desaturase)